MTPTSQPALIVGAGPVGLGAALFLTRRGLPVRIIEMRDAPSVQSRALAVNPRTLDILEPTGVTAEMLRLGLRVRGVRFQRRGRVIGRIDFDGIHPRYPFMLALSQATTERLLERALSAAGRSVERGVRLVNVRPVGDHVDAVVQRASDVAGAAAAAETIRAPWMLAADGAHSVARRQLNVPFEGATFRREWYLADVPLNTKLPEDLAHVFFITGGAFVFMIRVVDDQLKSAAPLWRVMTNRPHPVAVLSYAEGEAGVAERDRSVAAGVPVWESSFRIAHRLDATLSKDGVFFAGDAAHVHSPLGARGMNLGVEDVWVLSELAAAGRLAEYDRLRRPVDHSVVRRVELLSKMASAESPLFGFVRRSVFPRAMELRTVRRFMLRTVTGLDHHLPAIARV